MIKPGYPEIRGIMNEKTSGEASSPHLRCAHAREGFAFAFRPSTLISVRGALRHRSRIADDLHYIHGWKSEKGALP